MSTNKGQALIELIIGFAILSIVLVSVTFLLIGAREGRERSSNILAAETTLIFQNEAIRSIREAGWSNFENGTYHIIAQGTEYNISICERLGGCDTPPDIYAQDTKYSFGSGELNAEFTPYTNQPIVEVWVGKTSGCSGLGCFASSTIKNLKLTGLNPNEELRVSICPQASCAAEADILAEFVGTTNGSGELSASFPDYPAQFIVEVWLALPPPCSGLGCFRAGVIETMTLNGLAPGTGWELASGSETISGFTRQIDIEDTCRDSGGTIVDCPSGTIDPSTKKLTSSISWTKFFGGSVENTSYLTRNLNNDTWVQTSQADFSSGSFILTEASPSGEVGLLPGSARILSTFNNPGGANGFDTFVLNNYTYLTTANGGANPDLTIIDSSNPSSLPPVPVGSINLNTRVNAVHVEDTATAGRFAYLATADNAKELIVVDVSNKSNPTEAASLNLGGSQNANDIFIEGNGNQKFAYVGKQSGGGTNRELYIVSVNTCFDVDGDDFVRITDIFMIIFDQGNSGSGLATDLNGDLLVDAADIDLAVSRYELNCPHAPNPNIVGEFEVGTGNPNANAVNGVYVSNNTAYLATSNNTKELIVVDVSVKTNPTEAGFFNITPGGSNANDVFVDGTTAYLVTNNRAGSRPEFFRLDVSNPSSLSGSTPIGTFDLGGRINAVSISGNLAYLATNLANKQFTALDISNPASISEFSSVSLSAQANGIFVKNNIGYIATNHNSRELQVVTPGSGIAFESSGSYESQTFDCTTPTSPATQICDGDEAGFNYLTWNIRDPDGPGSTFEIKFQIETSATDGPWNFAGPMYDSPTAIPLDSVKGRYFRLRATLTGDGNNTPILEDFTMNYSP